MYDAEGSVSKKQRKADKEMDGNSVNLKIRGMMCEKCVAHVKEALTSVDGAAEAEVSLKDGMAAVTLSRETEISELIRAVENAGYKAKKA